MTVRGWRRGTPGQAETGARKGAITLGWRDYSELRGIHKGFGDVHPASGASANTGTRYLQRGKSGFSPRYSNQIWHVG